MKTKYIIIILAIAVAIAIFLSAYSDSSSYRDFAFAKDNPGEEFHVVGSLVKSKPMVYNPIKDANLFEFYMTDQKGEECKVMYFAPKPQDFDRSDKIVTIGKYENGVFQASKILLKCPSKYEEENKK